MPLPPDCAHLPELAQGRSSRGPYLSLLRSNTPPYSLAFVQLGAEQSYCTRGSPLCLGEDSCRRLYVPYVCTVRLTYSEQHLHVVYVDVFL